MRTPEIARVLCNNGLLKTGARKVRPYRLPSENFAPTAPNRNAFSMFKLPLLAVLLLGTIAMTRAESIYDVPVKDIDGKATTLAPYKGRVLLIVNVASECGFTPQYTGLEATYKKLEAQGLTVLGFPCNQFGGQEPGSNADIKKFCTTEFHVTFPMFEKIEVNGASRHPLYTILAGEGSPFPGNIGWNFTKFLIGRDGKILQRFDSKAAPDSAAVVAAIEAALAAKTDVVAK